MKVTFPKNIKKGILAGMTLNLGPLSISIVQLLLTAVGVGLALAVFNAGSRSGSTAAGIIFAIPVLLIFLLVAFFKLSEMSMLEYIAKIFRNKFFDTTRKFQMNFEKQNATDILIKESKGEVRKQKFEQKSDKLGEGILEEIEDGSLL